MQIELDDYVVENILENILREMYDDNAKKSHDNPVTKKDKKKMRKAIRLISEYRGIYLD